MPEELEGDQRVTDEEPSRRTFLKVSAVAGATVAAIAAGASVIPKIASTGAAAVKSASSGKEEAEVPVVTSAVSADPLIMVVRGDAVDVYRGESKVAVQDATLAKELTSRIAAKVQ